MVQPDPASPSADLGTLLAQQLRTAQVRIPPYPAVASSIDRLSRDPRSTVADVTKIIATDAALAATVLRHSSSAAMRTGGPATLESAVKKLGFDELTRVVIATTVGGAASARGPLAVLRRDQWRRSLLAAMFCRELAPRRGIAAEQAFLAGLLHDFGAIVVVACLESLGIDALPVMPEAEWRRFVEDHHVEHGMVVVGRWQLPEPIAEVVAHHHAPDGCMRVYRPLVQLVAIVDEIIAVLDRGVGGGIAALAEIPGLELDERMRIGALMPQVREQMSRFETPDRDVVSPIVQPDAAVDDRWPVDFSIEGRGRTYYRACSLGPATLVFRSRAALQPAWLVELTLHCVPDVIPMLAHVKTCRPAPSGGFLVTAQPFGLAGDEDLAWHRLIERTRPAVPAAAHADQQINVEVEPASPDQPSRPAEPSAVESSRP